ncbi:MAG TPA: DUF262 domain-containing protein [Nostocaceae cyanobacterium]|nr:DUF262 domain-containing protein [Nostocaceae cyanobacterium]
MKASETSLRNLIEGDKQFKIPLYQRPYSWNKENWENIWDDLMSLYEFTEGNHFLGSIVTLAIPGTPDGISPYTVIDGQQRLTTLSLLLLALRDHLKKNHPELAEELHEKYLINKFKRSDAFYKIVPTKSDRDLYQKIVQSQEIDKIELIYEAYKFFIKNIEEAEQGKHEQLDSKLDVTKLKTIILERVSLVSITLNENDNNNPYLIFESLNYKGSPLTQADLIRNYFFLKITDESKHDEIYYSLWFPLQEKFKNVSGEGYLNEMTLAIWQYLRKDGSPVKLNQIYQTFKQRFEKNKPDPLDELKEVKKFAEYYINIRFPDAEKETKLAKWFKRFKRLDFSTCYPLIINLYHDYATQRIALSDFEQALRYIESYFVRRLLCGMPSNALDKVFINLYQQINKQKDRQDSSDLVRNLCTILLNLQRSQLWPDDNLLTERIIGENVYSIRRKDRIKLILESLAEHLSKEQVNPENLSIEHIMPQKLTNEWQDMIGANAKDLHNRWLHTLGNLTLTAYNAEQSNKPFTQKRIYLDDSNFALNKYFREINAWNADEIELRAKHLAKIAIEVWPRPEASDSNEYLF